MLAAQTGAFALTVIANGERLPSYLAVMQRGRRTLLSARMVFEALGAEVTWDKASRSATITRGDKEVRLIANEKVAYVNGQPVALRGALRIIGGGLYMPIRFPAQALGAEVHFDRELQQVTITLPPLEERALEVTRPEPLELERHPDFIYEDTYDDGAW